MPRSPSPKRRLSNANRLRMDDYGPSRNHGIGLKSKGKTGIVSKGDLDKAMKNARRGGAAERNYWTKQLLEAEEKDPTRWRHSGFKEMYHSEFGGNGPNNRNSRSRSSSRGGRSNRQMVRRNVKPAVTSRGRSRSRSRGRARTSSSSTSRSRSPIRRKNRRDSTPPRNKGHSPVRNRRSRSYSRSSSDSSYSCSTCRTASSESSEVSVRIEPSSSRKKPVRRGIVSSSTSKKKRSPSPVKYTRLKQPNKALVKKVDNKPRVAMLQQKQKPTSSTKKTPEQPHNLTKRTLHTRITQQRVRVESPIEVEPDSTHQLRRTVVRKLPTRKTVKKRRRAEKDHAAVETIIISSPTKNGSEADALQRNGSTSGSESGESESSSDSEDLAQQRMSLSDRFSKLAQLSEHRRKFDHLKSLRIIKDTNTTDMTVIMDDNVEVSSTPPNSPEQDSFPPDYERYSYFSKRIGNATDTPRDVPTPVNWDSVRVRYNYYRDNGYFHDRDVSFDDYVKWEEWWYQYQDWLEARRFYSEVTQEREWSYDNFDRTTDLRTRKLSNRDNTLLRKRRKF